MREEEGGGNGWRLRGRGKEKYKEGGGRDGGEKKQGEDM